MKQQYFQPAFSLFIMVLLATATLNSGCKTKAAVNSGATTVNRQAIPALLERKGELAKAGEWERTKAKVGELNLKIARDPNDIKSMLQLATIYITEARITGEHPYYYPALMKLLDGVLAMDSRNFEALVYKASVKMSQHQFAEAKKIAEQARSVNPDNAYVYGVLVDANVELGHYEEAVQMSDKMQVLKPSLESYSRASYLREIYGDYPGAIEAMKMAVQAGLPGSEPWCWTKKTLGHLYEKTAKWEEAGKQYNEILAIRPSYAFALAGLAKIQKAANNYTKALELLNQAAGIMPEFSFHEEMADIYMVQGEKQKAAGKYTEVIAMLKEDENSGHTVSLELSRVYTKTGNFEKAIEEAMKEYAQRPLNIDVNHTLAWAYYKNGITEKAARFMKTALKTGSRDPELRERAILVEKAG